MAEQCSGQSSPNNRAMPVEHEAPQVGVTKGQPEEMVSTEAPNQPESSFITNQPKEVPIASATDKIDLSMDTTEKDGEEFEELGEENTKCQKLKGYPRNPTYQSIIRTRRASGMDSVKNSKHEEPLQNIADEINKDEQNISDLKEKRSNRGRGRGGRGGVTVKRFRSSEKETVVDESVNKGGRGRGKSPLVKGDTSLRKLPRRPKKQKSREEECDGEEEEIGPLLKKCKLEKDNSKEEDDHVTDSDKEGTKSSPYRGKGNRRRGKRGRFEIKVEDGGEEQEQKKNEEEKEEKPMKKKRGRPKKKPMELTTPTTNEPTDDMSTCMPSGSQQPVTEPVKDVQEIVELLELSENMGNEGEQNDNGDNNNTPVTDTQEMESTKTEDDKEIGENDNTVTEDGVDNIGESKTNNDSESKTNNDSEDITSEDITTSEDKPQTVDNEIPNNDNETKTSHIPNTTVIDDSSNDKEKNNSQKENKDITMETVDNNEETTNTTTTTTSVAVTQVVESMPPSTTVPLEPTYPFPGHRFPPLDDQGFHPFPPMPHPFLSGYPPFSSPPYPTFMIPTSPHFPQSPYPPECLPPELYGRFSEDYGRFALPPIPQGVTTPTSCTITSQGTEMSVSIVDTPPNSTSPIPSSTHATCIPMPLPLSQGYAYTLTSPYGPPPMIGQGMPPSMIPAGEWSMGPPQAPPHIPPSVPHHAPPTTSAPSPKTTKEGRFPQLNLMPTSDETTLSQPVDCPECGRHFKNNKALNGHMRLHGGFDWTRRPYQVMQSRQQLLAKEIEKKATTPSATNTVNYQPDTKSTDQQKKTTKTIKQQTMKNGLKVSNQQNVSSVESRHTGTLDDLCRAAEELERIERNGFKNKPIPLILPREKRLQQSFSPPYTPPPILSPARSLMMLSNSTERLHSNITHVTTSDKSCNENLLTPNKIWTQRKVSDHGGPVDQEEMSEPKINIGREFQADLPPFKVTNIDDKVSPPPYNSNATLAWSPLEGLLQEDEDTIDGFLELSCSPAIPNGGRNKELALHTLHQVKGSVKEAVRLMVMGKTMLTPDENLANYKYTGSKRWSSRERQQFRRAWRVDRKQFHSIQKQLETKSLPDVIEYYYSWKKYCPDEYRGRNRHHSEEILSEEDNDIYVHPSSVASTSSGSNDADASIIDNEHHQNPPATKNSNSGRSLLADEKPSMTNKHKTTPSKASLPPHVMDHQPRGFYSSQHHHSMGSQFGGMVQEYRCKYPGCNQVYTSIFALNGHIRVHGGSWYPKKPDVENMLSSSKDYGLPPNCHHQAATPSYQGNIPLSKLKKEKDEEDKLRHQLEIAKTMVMDLPQPRSPVQTITPSPRPSPSHSKLIKSKKVSSASPSDREGHYPCNRCGRVFPKVKSRSAHMKSHIVKPLKQQH